MLKRFKILTSNVYSSAHFKVNYLDEPRKTNGEIEKLIKKAWAKKKSESDKRRAPLYSDDLCRLMDYKASENVFELTLGPTTYKDLVGTNVQNPWIYSRFGAESLSNALGVSAVVVTADNKLVFGQRRAELAYDAGMTDVCGGFIRPVQDARMGLPDPFLSVTHWVSESLKISEGEIEYLNCLGLVQNFVTLKPELVFEVKIKLNSTDLNPPSAVPGPGGENRLSEFLFVNDDASELREFLVKRESGMTFICQACIWVYAIRRRYWSSFDDLRASRFVRRLPPVTALVLSGGFAKGFAHIGVFKVLEEIGLKIDLIVGNSIGGLMGAAYASKVSYELCEQAARAFEWKKISDWTFPKWGLLKGKKLEEYIRTVVTYDKFSDLQIPMAVITADLVSGEEVVLCDQSLAGRKKVYDRANPFFVFGKEIATNLAYDHKVVYEEAPLHMAIHATCSFPGIFQPVRWGKRLLVDGTVCDNIPVKIARRLGAEFIIAVDLGVQKPVQELRNIFEVIMTAHMLQSDKLARYQLKGADVVIRPEVDHLRFNDFKNAGDAISAGETAARSLMPVIKDRWIKKSKFNLAAGA